MGELSAALYGAASPEAQAAGERWTTLFKTDQVQTVLAEARERVKQLGGPRREAALTHLAHFEHNQDRMRYGTYRQEGLFYGSGVVEAGCKTVIAQRLKNSGMFWTEEGARNVAVLRCALLDQRFDAYWDQRHHTDQFTLPTAAQSTQR